MSYSRFSNSTWYTFWSSASPKGLLKKKDQLFEICDMVNYYVSYAEIVGNVDAVLKDVKLFFSSDREGYIFDGIDPDTDQLRYTKTIYPAKNPTEKEMLELRGYMLEFIKDVDLHYKPLTYFRYECYYPIRNKIRRAWLRLMTNEL